MKISYKINELFVGNFVVKSHRLINNGFKSCILDKDNDLFFTVSERSVHVVRIEDD